ncbi:uncharacterized protein LOC109709884 [Ananas comosus]|uniref:Uncharacterized protein LOC109709884 n=1 Tax=Ananas comosus TaxID=4615 RepID=A0A6P5F3E5_ANACO|nr:uncharacterized protein LOC109709884 [Ananas comosus]
MFDGMPLRLGEGAVQRHEWALQRITNSVLKCTRWQVEETTDLINCPYHYFCESAYPGDYPSFVDFLVLLFAAASFVSTLSFTVIALRRRTAAAAAATTATTPRSSRNLKRKYLVPSGPIFLPFVLLILARGQRINTIFPLSQLGPAILQLLQASALAFKNESDKDIRYAVLEASTVSGILHASLYLDAIIMPYYTGIDALSGSRFSGECPSCLCRTQALVVGGTEISYRGLSKTTLLIIFALCARMVRRMYGEERFSLAVKSVLEGISWVFVASDCVYMMNNGPEGGALFRIVYGGLCVFIFLNVFKMVYSFLSWAERRHVQLEFDRCDDEIV